MNKYRAKKTVVDGITFDSKAEARRYSQLKILERAGEISGLTLQPQFPVTLNGKDICRYIADFAYFTDHARVVEDVKSDFTAKNPIYRLKKKLVEAAYPGVQIVEVTNARR